MFKKILIANRGEIALRIIRTCKRMGIKTVAVYSEADTNALHVSAADQAVYIGPSPADQSYLVTENILGAARKTGAEAVHPGYGFLSENAEFAHRIAREGIAFIGPGRQAIRLMGDKISAKKIAGDAKVNTIPGYTGSVKDTRAAGRIAAKIGFPVMIKAASGGGGKGMRIVKGKEEIKQAYQSVVNEARKSFRDSKIFIEKFIESPRHIEIQVLADQHGNVLCLGERECSIQRHHQKVIEEAPSPFLDSKTRERMYEQAAALVRRVKYVSAGTLEFIVDKKRRFYFLEMNTRLQVEHPVTEMITGLDLVEWMIRIAAGEKLPFKQEDIKLSGWAMESRIYAEDPSRGFLPSTGRITEYRPPEESANVRVDSGVYAGGEVSMFYDAMIAKLITYGKDRAEAIQHMRTALGQFMISGISHNISFLEAVMGHPRFGEGRLSTNFIAEEYPDGFSGARITEETTKVFLAVGLYIYLKDAHRAAGISGQILNRRRQIGTRWVITVDRQGFSVYVRQREGGLDVTYENERFEIYSNWTLGSGLFQGKVDTQVVNVRIEPLPGGYRLTHAGATAKVTVRTPRVAELEKFMPERSFVDSETRLLAPISGQVVTVKVKEGDKVSKGQDLVVLEAMKMENLLYAERDAVIQSIHVQPGDNVQVNQTLIEFEKEKNGE